MKSFINFSLLSNGVKESHDGFENDARMKKHPFAVYDKICKWPTLERRLRDNLFYLGTIFTDGEIRIRK